MKVYGHPMSTCTRKVLMTLAETKTPHELIVVDFATGEHKKPPHMARQPFGRLPAIDDDGFSMFESRAIMRYIDEKVDGGLTPKDLKGRAIMEQWISVEMEEFTRAAMKFVYEHVFKRPQGEVVLADAAKQMDLALGVMNTRLEKNDYFAGKAFSLADIALMPYVEYVMMTPAKEHITKHPHVASWWNRVSERPTWQKIAGR